MSSHTHTHKEMSTKRKRSSVKLNPPPPLGSANLWYNFLLKEVKGIDIAHPTIHDIQFQTKIGL